MRFGSVCSGIEAASVAFEPLGWQASWFSEIEPFPSAVLDHHWPDVPNLGDMLALPARMGAGEIEAPDVLVGGPPCQSFSPAGRRESLSDPRGNLTLAYVELADAIDRQRVRDGKQPCVVLYENVPGILSTKDNAFGCFLAGLAGEDEPLLPPGKRWTNAGIVLGPQRAVAWRILDAQYFGLAQRRRRVFVVASARNGFDPSQVLLEFDGLRRDSPPRRETGQEIARNAGPGFEVAGTLDSRVKGGGFPGSDGAMGGHVVPEKRPAEIASTLNAHYGSKWGLEDQHINQNAPLFVPACTAVTGDIAHTLNTANNGKGCSEDGTGRGVPTIAFSSKDYGADASEDMSPTLRAGGHAESHANAGVPPAVAFAQNTRDEVRLLGGDDEITGALAAQPGMKQTTYVAPNMAVRRLTPTECERLQGFTPRAETYKVFACWEDKSLEPVPAEVRCTTVQNNALRVEGVEKLENVRSAGRILRNAPPSLASPVGVCVLIDFAEKRAVLLSAGRLIWSANIAGEQNESRLSMLPENSALLLVQMLRSAAKTAPDGGVVSHQNGTVPTGRENGSSYVDESGEMPEGAARVADLDTEDQNRFTTCITCILGQRPPKNGLTRVTLLCSVVRAIALYTHGITPLASSFSLDVTVVLPHTLVPYRNKPAADGPRYKAIGNSMAVPCMYWIGSRIQRHLTGDL